ncbi:hypothetical protein TNCV_2583131 [Trichonephila clavipes]|nr:hypothetical protein TNCV_2583131 [Trichonephila clavipes]
MKEGWLDHRMYVRNEEKSMELKERTGAPVQRNSSTVMLVWKQWIDEQRTTRKTGSGRRKVTSAYDDRHLFLMVMNDRTAFSRQVGSTLVCCYRCANVGFIN